MMGTQQEQPKEPEIPVDVSDLEDLSHELGEEEIAKVTPIQPRLTSPFSTIWRTTLLAVLMGIAKPIPCARGSMSELMPMTSP